MTAHAPDRAQSGCSQGAVKGAVAKFPVPILLNNIDTQFKFATCTAIQCMHTVLQASIQRIQYKLACKLSDDPTRSIQYNAQSMCTLATMACAPAIIMRRLVDECGHGQPRLATVAASSGRRGLAAPGRCPTLSVAFRWLPNIKSAQMTLSNTFFVRWCKQHTLSST